MVFDPHNIDSRLFGLLQVDREFIEDSFNLYGLRALVPHYNEALDMILDIERMDEAPNEERQVRHEHLHSSVSVLCLLGFL